LLTALVAVVAAQSRPLAPTPERWLDAVERHVAGADDQWVSQVQAWSLDDLQAALSALGRLDRPNADAVLKRASVLHTDVAILRHKPGGYNLPDNGRPSVLIRDGETLGSGAGTYHWAFARLCLARLRLPVDEYERRWYQAVAATLHQFGDYPELELHFEKGAGRFPDDPILEFYAGAMHEAYSGPHVQRSRDGQERLPSNSRTGPPAALPGTERKEQELAADAFRRALKADASLVEARIRLGEVLDAQGKHDEAAAELQRALTATLTPRLEYWGRLLLGRAEHARDHLDAAARAFERARVLFPDAPAPVFGLSQVARDRGERDTALTRLRELPNAMTLSLDADPWWNYYWTHDPDAPTLLRALWATVNR
jgi:tetratricopeptide (TPR) repeat protein